MVNIMLSASAWIVDGGRRAHLSASASRLRPTPASSVPAPSLRSCKASCISAYACRSSSSRCRRSVLEAPAWVHWRERMRWPAAMQYSATSAACRSRVPLVSASAVSLAASPSRAASPPGSALASSYSRRHWSSVLSLAGSRPPEGDSLSWKSDPRSHGTSSCRSSAAPLPSPSSLASCSCPSSSSAARRASCARCCHLPSARRHLPRSS
mmetsp:Transcript_42926/g.109817  ORF Transcript_42926/g.109817 Transcript_42926/m.109817 type:complete len:210 (-) Transcript_42926:2397-3026(-)